MNWPTLSEINMNNIKVGDLLNMFNNISDKSNIDKLSDIFNQAILINPNNTSGVYSEELNNLKYKLYQLINNNDNNNVININNNDNNNVININNNDNNNNNEDQNHNDNNNNNEDQNHNDNNYIYIN
jgi:50S ribosomal subunit-associated GTPase HflX